MFRIQQSLRKVSDVRARPLASVFSLSSSFRLRIFHARTRSYVPTLAYYMPRRLNYTRLRGLLLASQHRNELASLSLHSLLQT
jgi:hypothetical protein